MVDENHFFCLNTYSRSYEFGKRYCHLCPLMSVTVTRDITDAETQTSRDRRRRGPVQPKAVQVARLLRIHRIRFCSRIRSLHRSMHTFPPWKDSTHLIDTLPLIVLTFIDSSAHSQGVSGHVSSYLVAIVNAGSGVGRVSCGFIADRVGACIPPDTLTYHIPHPFRLSPLHVPPTSHLFS